MRFHPKYWLGFLVGGGFLAYALLKMDFGLVWKSMAMTHWIYLPFTVAIVFVQIYLRGLRWYYILEPIKRIPTTHLVAATAIGFMSNQILPARMGEFIRAYVIGDKAQISKTSSFATIVVERVFDGITVLIFLVYVLIFLQVPPHLQGTWEKVRIFGIVSAVFFPSLFLLFFLLNRGVPWVKKLFGIFFSFFPRALREKLEHMFGLFVGGLGVVERGHHILAILAYSVVLWGLSILINMIFFRAFEMPLPVIAAITILLMQAFSVTLPSPPGYMGTFHAGSVIGFAFFGVPKEQALGVAILMHASLFVSQVLCGLYYLWIEKMSFSEIRHVPEGEDKVPNI